MDIVPFYRRPAFRTGIGLLFWLVAYIWLRRSAGEPLSLPLVFSVFLGLLSLLAIFIFMGQLIPSGMTLSSLPGEVLRLLVVMLWIALHIMVLLPIGGYAAYRTGLTHLDLALISLFLMLSLAAQFVLPVRSLTERATAVGRVLRYLVGLSGPVVFIHNGKAKESLRARHRKGPGVLLVDHASAAVLRTDVRFTGAVGPGVTFTAVGERLAEALDLRRQVRRLPAQKPTTAEEAKEQSRTSLAVTKDGIPVSADLRVTFILHPGGSAPPREGAKADLPPLEFYPIATGRAVYGHAYGARYDVPWSKLPLLLAVDLWREEVKGRDLPSLFSTGHEEQPPSEEIQARILARLTRPFYEFPDANGKSIRRHSREFGILKERGIRVLGVSVSGLLLPEDIEDEHVLRWRENWSGAVHEFLQDAQREAQEKRRIGRRQAYQVLSEDLTAGLRAELARQEAPNRRDTLALILLDAIRVCDRKEMIPEGSALAAHLERMRADVLGLSGDCQPPTMDGQP